MEEGGLEDRPEMQPPLESGWEHSNTVAALLEWGVCPCTLCPSTPLGLFREEMMSF